MIKTTHILIFEPRVQGHHLSWLHYITEDFLCAGFRVTLAVDDRPHARERIREELSLLTGKVQITPIFNEAGKLIQRGKLGTIAACLKESNAQEVLMPNLDEIASNCLRLAAIGIYPPRILKGRLSGVYHRPRSLSNPNWPPGNFIKTMGLRRLSRNGWFKNIWLVDEYLAKTVGDEYPGLALHFIPDPGSGDFSIGKEDARKALCIPMDRFVFLNYGIPARRKGLHIAVRAMCDAPSGSRLLLLCAGRLVNESEVINGLEKLKARRLAIVMDRHISDLEEKLCFCASDVVLLPYIKHFGSSAILSRAAAAGRMVIASDEGLIAKRVRDHHLGWLFPTENSDELLNIMQKAAELPASDMAMFRQSALRYGRSCSREAFRASLIGPYKD